MDYTIITENDVSEWSDQTGELYHFPVRYLKFLDPGNRVIYYKGKLRDQSYKDLRLTNEPHYFGIGSIGSVYKDVNSLKKDYFATIINFIPFIKPVLAKQQNSFLEVIPENRINNYWRDAVRPIKRSVYDSIIKTLDATISHGLYLNDLNQGSEESYTTIVMEGEKKVRYSTYYERKPAHREKALLIHGYSCKACNFNFEKMYGEKGKDFIHIHHIKPLYQTGRIQVNAETDLVPLCANCHSMVHRRRDDILTIDQLKEMINNHGAASIYQLET